MERKCGGRDERFVTVAAGTVVIGRLVELGVQVLTEVVLVLEVPFAVGAVDVHVAIVFLKLCVVVEILLIMRFRQFRLSGGGGRKVRLTSLHARQT